jgi:hypothetical protein
VPNALQSALAADYARSCTTPGDDPSAAAPPAAATGGGGADPTSVLLWVTEARVH